jgi:hypothetical protein
VLAAAPNSSEKLTLELLLSFDLLPPSLVRLSEPFPDRIGLVFGDRYARLTGYR